MKVVSLSWWSSLLVNQLIFISSNDTFHIQIIFISISCLLKRLSCFQVTYSIFRRKNLVKDLFWKIFLNLINKKWMNEWMNKWMNVKWTSFYTKKIWIKMTYLGTFIKSSILRIFQFCECLSYLIMICGKVINHVYYVILCNIT